MVKPAQRAEVSTFVQGIITEASLLNFPPNASKDEENFELNTDGSRDRRLGIDYEPGYSLINTGLSGTTPSILTYKWTSVSGTVGLDYAVVAVNHKLYFFDISALNLTTAGFISSVITLPVSTDHVKSMSAIDGKLVVVNGSRSVFVIERAGAGFTYTQDVLKVRDTWGVEETINSAYEVNPNARAAINDQHRYNLLNQGWSLPRTYKDGVIGSPIDQYTTDLGVAPSNSDVVWTGLQFQPVASGTDPSERFFPNIYKDTLGIAGPAARGYFLIDPLYRGYFRQTVASIPTVPNDYTEGGYTVIAEFAGRIFYGGINGLNYNTDKRSPSLNNCILFSQLVTGISSIYKCYQEGDPTSRDASELVDTDGGLIKVSGAKDIISLQNFESHLIVIASNGVWAVTGGSDFGFTATNYKVSKLSSVGGLNHASVVVEGGRIYYWAEDGIYVIAKDQMGDLGVESLTRTTIHSLYNNIPLVDKKKAAGVYDPYSRKVRWVYRHSESTMTSNKELVLDVVLGAFVVNRIGSSVNEYIAIVGAVSCKTYATSIRSGDTHSLRYTTLVYTGGSYRFTFSYYHNELFKDWVASGASNDAKAYLYTGALTGGDSSAFKQVTYMVMHFRKTEKFVNGSVDPIHPSSCLVRCLWDWTDNESSNRWAKQFQAYRPRRVMFYTAVANENNNGLETIVSKSKIRGRGRAFAFYMETEPNKDCRILGWSLTLTGNNNV